MINAAKATEVAERVGSMDIAGRFEASKTSSVMDVATEVELTMTVAIANVSVVDGISEGASDGRSTDLVCNAVAKSTLVSQEEIIVAVSSQETATNDIAQNFISLSLLLTEVITLKIGRPDVSIVMDKNSSLSVGTIVGALSGAHGVRGRDAMRN